MISTSKLHKSGSSHTVQQSCSNILLKSPLPSSIKSYARLSNVVFIFLIVSLFCLPLVSSTNQLMFEMDESSTECFYVDVKDKDALMMSYQVSEKNRVIKKKKIFFYTYIHIVDDVYSLFFFPSIFIYF